ncbi:hypothetical protein DL98DRAFT_586634 [Cadophora sp. DSE1049]|nr:hypothetical protein DL98DRAFT_586634 [Cadophora sp. DSE1049]
MPGPWIITPLQTRHDPSQPLPVGLWVNSNSRSFVLQSYSAWHRKPYLTSFQYVNFTIDTFRFESEDFETSRPSAVYWPVEETHLEFKPAMQEKSHRSLPNDDNDSLLMPTPVQPARFSVHSPDLPALVDVAALRDSGPIHHGTMETSCS